VIQLGGGEEWCVQRGSSNQAWRIKVSRAAGFTGGSPSATQVPTATDEQVFMGSGTDASPTGYTFLYTDGLYYSTFGIDTTAPRRLWWECHVVAGSTLCSLLFRDVLVPTEPSDADVFIRGFAGSGVSNISASTLASAATGTPTSAPYYMGYVPTAGTPTTVTHIPMTQDSVTSTPTFPGNTGTLLISGKDLLLAPRYQRASSLGAPVLLKGDSTLFAFCGANRGNGDLLSVASAGDRVCFSLLTMPWNNTVVVL
jgi:hypothetical protein